MNKIIKYIIIGSVSTIFFVSNYNVANAATDCKNPKGFHQKIVCKKFSLKNPFGKKENTDSNIETASEKGENTGSTLFGKNGIFKKIKKFNSNEKGQ